MAQTAWVGIDVGGIRKGFHVAVVQAGAGDVRAHDLGVRFREFDGRSAVQRTIDWAVAQDPARVAIDAPAAWAPADRLSRPEEAAFARAGICAIRFTPPAAAAAARTDDYYGWIEHGLELWTGLAQVRGVEAIECFPTASWTQWFGGRGARSRARWTRDALAVLAAQGLQGTGQASNQDRRDALAAALTARQADRDEMLRFGPLTVPPVGTMPL
jgi:predicted nuclease with RNAse H fold